MPLPLWATILSYDEYPRSVYQFRRLSRAFAKLPAAKLVTPRELVLNHAPFRGYDERRFTHDCAELDAFASLVHRLTLLEAAESFALLMERFTQLERCTVRLSDSMETAHDEFEWIMRHSHKFTTLRHLAVIHPDPSVQHWCGTNLDSPFRNDNDNGTSMRWPMQLRTLHLEVGCVDVELVNRLPPTLEHLRAPIPLRPEQCKALVLHCPRLHSIDLTLTPGNLVSPDCWRAWACRDAKRECSWTHVVLRGERAYYSDATGFGWAELLDAVANPALECLSVAFDNPGPRDRLYLPTWLANDRLGLTCTTLNLPHVEPLAQLGDKVSLATRLMDRLPRLRNLELGRAPCLVMSVAEASRAYRMGWPALGISAPPNGLTIRIHPDALNTEWERRTLSVSMATSPLVNTFKNVHLGSATAVLQWTATDWRTLLGRGTGWQSVVLKGEYWRDETGLLDCVTIDHLLQHAPRLRRLWAMVPCAVAVDTLRDRVLGHPALETLRLGPQARHATWDPPPMPEVDAKLVRTLVHDTPNVHVLDLRCGVLTSVTAQQWADLIRDWDTSGLRKGRQLTFCIPLVTARALCRSRQRLLGVPADPRVRLWAYFGAPVGAPAPQAAPRPTGHALEMWRWKDGRIPVGTYCVLRLSVP